jgi:hypothetical protein
VPENTRMYFGPIDSNSQLEHCDDDAMVSAGNNASFTVIICV